MRFTLIVLFWTGICLANQPDVRVVEESQQLQKQVFTEDYKMIADDVNNTDKVKLNQLIEQLNSLTFQLEVKKAEITKDSNIPSKDVNDSNQVDEINSTEFELQQNFDIDPNEVVDPLKLGDVLYSKNMFSKATVYYEKALKDLENSDKANVHDKGWVLFQLGNCWKNYDYEKSLKYYEKVLSSYPDSKWSDIALIEKQLAELMINENKTVNTLINKGSVDG